MLPSAVRLGDSRAYAGRLRAAQPLRSAARGTDYGAREKPIEEKIADVERQLERDEAVIVFDAATATTNIVPARGTTT